MNQLAGFKARAENAQLECLLLELCDAFYMDPAHFTYSEAMVIHRSYLHCGMDILAGQWADAWNHAEAANTADDSGERL